MTDAQYNRLKESLLAGDRLAFRELLTDDDAANRANNDPEVMAYLETQEMSDYLTADEVEAVENLSDFANKLRSLAENIISDTLTIKTPKDLEAAKELLPLFNEISEMLISSIRGLQEQQPYITELINRPEYKDLTPRQFRYEEHTDENGNKYTFFDKFKKDLAELIAADKEKNQPTAELKPDDKKELPQVARIRKLLQAKDAPNAISIKGQDTLWGLTKKQLEEINNQFTLVPRTQPLDVQFITGKENNEETFISIAYNFDKVQGKFDGLSFKHKAVHDAIANLQHRGYTKATLTEIFYASALSKGSPPNGSDLKFIYEAIKVMRDIEVLYDNTHDYTSYREKMGEYVIRQGKLLDIPAFDYGISDKQLKTIVVILGNTPAPLLDAAMRKGLTYSVPLKVVQTPLRKDNSMLELQAYMLESIEYMKDPKKNRSREILIKTMLEKLGKPGNRVYKERLLSDPGYLVKLLDYWKKIDYIKGYSIEWDRVIIKIKGTTPKLSQKP